MTERKDQNPSQAAGQQGIGKETERRNRENETGQTGFGKEGGPSAETDTTLASQDSEKGDSGFVATAKPDSSDYLTKGEEEQAFAEQGQGAQDSSAGKADIETGKPTERDASVDDGSSAR